MPQYIMWSDWARHPVATSGLHIHVCTCAHAHDMHVHTPETCISQANIFFKKKVRYLLFKETLDFFSSEQCKYGGQRLVSGVFFNHSLLYFAETWSLSIPGTQPLARLTDQPYVPSTGVTGMCCHTSLFIWVLGIRTVVLVQQALYPLSLLLIPSLWGVMGVGFQTLSCIHA